jgi:hypothetical protein
MRRLMLVLVTLAACSTPQNWRKRDQAIEGSTTIDWVQSIHIVDDCKEGNPIIGACGERLHPNIYFPIVLLTQAQNHDHRCIASLMRC